MSIYEERIAQRRIYRTAEEIHRALCAITKNDVKEDTFEQGMIMGKILALEWVLGCAPGSDVACQFDYESYMDRLLDQPFMEDELQAARDEVARDQDEGHDP